MEWSASWKVIIAQPLKKSPILWNTMVHYRAHESSSLNIRSQTNPVHILLPIYL
jgi:hypothetical protein